MINPISSLPFGGVLSAATSGLQRTAAGFADLLGGASAPSPVKGPGSTGDVTERLAERFRHFLEKMGFDPNQPLELEIDASGDAWLRSELAGREAEFEGLLGSDKELRNLFGEWADAHSPPEATATFRWPLQVDEKAVRGAY